MYPQKWGFLSILVMINSSCTNTTQIQLKYKNVLLLHIEYFSIQVQIDNEKCRRDRDARLSGSRLDLNFCVPRGTSRTSRRLDSLSNTLTPISPPSNNNSIASSRDDDDDNNPHQLRNGERAVPKQPVPLSPTGESIV